MKKIFIFLTVILIQAFTWNSLADSISNIQISPISPASLLNNESVTINFNYNTTEAGGVLIFVRPFSGGGLSPDYSASGSPIYPMGTGVGSGNFTITAGTVMVDQLRFQMTNADQSVTILEFFIDVTFLFSEHSIRNIVMAPNTPMSLQNGEQINIFFDYGTTEASGVRIWARPFTGGNLTPEYGASGSPLYPTGTGSGASNFTINSGNITVDAIRFQMWDDGQANLLLEWFVPVEYIFGSHSISGVVTNPESPALLLFNEDITVNFNYSTSEAGGVLIFARPFTGGDLTPNYGASGSPLYPVGSGTGTGTFNIGSGETNIDAIRIQMWDNGQTTLLYETFFPVNFFVSEHRVNNITFDPPSPAYLMNNQDVTINFDYSTSFPGGVRIFFRPFSGGWLSPDYAASGSPLYPAGTSNGTGSFTITNGNILVDEMRVQIWDDPQTTLLLEYFFPVSFSFNVLTDVSDEVASIPTKFELMQNYPNPFNPATTICYQLPARSFVSLKIFSVVGNEVASLVDEEQTVGSYSVNFDASKFASGVYFYQLRAGNFYETKKLIVLK
ncbi:MAG: T9SS type A sorting domain-containing protein [bacterium]